MFIKISILRSLVVILLSASLVACAGRAANPAASYHVGDQAMSCEEIKAEMSHVQSQVDKLIPESKKTGKNAALGVAGLFLIVPWFFMDFSETERVEIKAYQERYLLLEKLYSRNDCVNKERTLVAPEGDDASQGVRRKMDKEDPKARLAVLKELLDQGLISEEEYEKQRLEVIESI